MGATENKVYDNFFLANEVEDQFKSHLDLQKFVTVNNDLIGTAGDEWRVNVYKGTDGTEKLEMGNGNTKSISVTYTEKKYKIQLAQNRFDWFDEQAMKDPMLVPVGMKHAATDMFNTVNKDIYEEYKKATLEVSGAGFDAFVDAIAKLNIEEGQNPFLFAFVSPKDTAGLRKALKDSLQYVEAFARTGYIGTVAGVNIYTKKDATEGVVIVATQKAVTIFNKKGVEVEQTTIGNRAAEDANKRLNSAFSRKYYVAALTDETQAVKINITPGV